MENEKIKERVRSIIAKKNRKDRSEEIFSLVYHAKIKKSELAQLKWNNVDFKNLHITVPSRRINKNVKIPPALEKVLKKFKEESRGKKYLFEQVGAKETLALFRYIQKLLIQKGFGDIGKNVYKRFGNKDDVEN